jgi:hypothetical protein
MNNLDIQPEDIIHEDGTEGYGDGDYDHDANAKGDILEMSIPEIVNAIPEMNEYPLRYKPIGSDALSNYGKMRIFVRKKDMNASLELMKQINTRIVILTEQLNNTKYSEKDTISKLTEEIGIYQSSFEELVRNILLTIKSNHYGITSRY